MIRRIVRLVMNGRGGSSSSSTLVFATLVLLAVIGTEFPVEAYKVAIWKMSVKTIDSLYDVYRQAGRKGYSVLTKSKTFTNLKPIQRGEALVRLAAKDGRITAFEAETLFKDLKGVKGFEKTAKWLMVGKGKGPIMSGALQELKIAGGLKKGGYEIMELRKPFAAANKTRATDIDLLVRKGGKSYAIENKAYARPLQWSQIAMDAESLIHFKNANPGTVPYFIFNQTPAPLAAKKLSDMGIKYLVVPDPAALKYLRLVP